MRGKRAVRGANAAPGPFPLRPHAPRRPHTP